MKRSQIIKEGRFIYNEEFPEFSSFELNLNIPLFDSKVKILAMNLISMESEQEIKHITIMINYLLSFNKENEVWLKEVIWDHYESSISNTSYSIVNERQFDNEIDANKFHFQIFNKEDAYQKVDLEMIWFDLSFLDYNYFNLEYNCPWEDEHGIKIGVMEGKFDSLE